MSGDIERERNGEVETLPEFVKVVVDGLGTPLIFFPPLCIVCFYQWEEEGAMGIGIPVHDSPHLRHPFHRHRLPRLMADISEFVPHNVGRREMRNVNERHASCDKGEDKEVAGKSFAFVIRPGSRYLSYVIERYGPFARLRLTRVDLLEKAIGQKNAFPDGSVARQRPPSTEALSVPILLSVARGR